MLTRLIKLAIFVFLLVLFAGSGCASERKVQQIIKRADSSCDLSHLGKNKIYYSSKYRKHLSNNIRKINRNNLK